MAKYRGIYVNFWSDPFIQSLSREKKLFYLYLITNAHTSQCGIYEITFQQIANEIGMKVEEVKSFIRFFTRAKKIKYSQKSCEIAVKNFIKYNPQDSPTVKIFVDNALALVKDRVLIGYLYGMGVIKRKEEEEEEEKKNKTKEKENANEDFSGLLLDAWKEWEKHLAEKRIPLTESSRAKQLKMLEAMTPRHAVDTIEYSIRNGYTGLFEPKQKANGRTNTKQEQTNARRKYTAEYYGSKPKE